MTESPGGARKIAGWLPVTPEIAEMARQQAETADRVMRSLARQLDRWISIETTPTRSDDAEGKRDRLDVFLARQRVGRRAGR